MQPDELREEIEALRRKLEKRAVWDCSLRDKELLRLSRRLDRLLYLYQRDYGGCPPPLDSSD